MEIASLRAQIQQLVKSMGSREGAVNVTAVSVDDGATGSAGVGTSILQQLRQSRDATGVQPKVLS